MSLISFRWRMRPATDGRYWKASSERIGRALSLRRWKLIHFEGGFRPMLFDLETDPDEFVDLGDSADHAEEVARMYDYLAQWGRRMSQRVTRSDADIQSMRGASMRRGVLPFLVDGSEVPPQFTEKYRGLTRQIHGPAASRGEERHDA